MLPNDRYNGNGRFQNSKSSKPLVDRTTKTIETEKLHGKIIHGRDRYFQGLRHVYVRRVNSFRYRNAKMAAKIANKET